MKSLRSGITTGSIIKGSCPHLELRILLYIKLIGIEIFQHGIISTPKIMLIVIIRQNQTKTKLVNIPIVGV